MDRRDCRIIQHGCHANRGRYAARMSWQSRNCTNCIGRFAEVKGHQGRSPGSGDLKLHQGGGAGAGQHTVLTIEQRAESKKHCDLPRAREAWANVQGARLTRQSSHASRADSPDAGGTKHTVRSVHHGLLMLASPETVLRGPAATPSAWRSGWNAVHGASATPALQRVSNGARSSAPMERESVSP